MAIPFHKPVSSIEAIQSSIEYDPQVYRWFLQYISHDEVKKKAAGSAELQDQYKALRNSELFTRTFLFLLAGITATAFMSKENILFVLWLPALWGLYRCSSLRRKQTGSISRALLIADKENIQFESKTLFQICEIYGKRLNIPTLVDTITRQDAIMRRTFIFACVTTCFIYPLDFWSNWAMIFASLFLIQILINTPLVFDRLK